MDLEPMEPLKPGESPTPGGISPGPDTSHTPVTAPANNDAALVRERAQDVLAIRAALPPHHHSGPGQAEACTRCYLDELLDRLAATAEKADELQRLLEAARNDLAIEVRERDGAEAALLAAQQDHDGLEERLERGILKPPIVWKP